MGIDLGIDRVGARVAHAGLSTALKATEALSAKDDFLEHAGVASPVPEIPGSIGAVGRQFFRASKIGIRADLISIFTYGDVIDRLPFCSSYFDPTSPWYNVFYGGYGIRSHEPDGSAWGYDRNGTPNFEEFLEVARIDYNDLTAGALGCPVDKRCFRVEEIVRTDKKGQWDFAEVVATVPSGLHDPNQVEASGDFDLRRLIALEYAVFGRPHAALLDGRPDYEPLRMRGHMHFRQVRERITFAWGALCPDREDGRALLDSIIAAMTPLYVMPLRIG